MLFDYGDEKGYYLKDSNQKIYHVWLLQLTEMFNSKKYIGFYSKYSDAKNILTEVPNGRIIKLEYNKKLDQLIVIDEEK